MIAESRKSNKILAYLENIGAYEDERSMSIGEAYAMLGIDAGTQDDQAIISVFVVRVRTHFYTNQLDLDVLLKSFR